MAETLRLASCTAAAIDVQLAILDITKIKKHRRNASHAGQELFQNSLGAPCAPVVPPYLGILLLTPKFWKIATSVTSVEEKLPRVLWYQSAMYAPQATRVRSGIPRFAAITPLHEFTRPSRKNLTRKFGIVLMEILLLHRPFSAAMWKSHQRVRMCQSTIQKMKLSTSPLGNRQPANALQKEPCPRRPVLRIT
jgi:hypothetical protein